MTFAMRSSRMRSTASEMISRLSSSPVMNRIQGSRHVQRALRCVREKWKGPGHRGEGCAGESEDRSMIRSFRERHDRVYGKEDRRFRRYQCQRCSRADHGKALGLLKTIIDNELERSCVESSVRVLADRAIANSLTAEKKVRQQVEQRRKERKQLKSQNRRGKVDEMASRVR